MGFSTLYYKVLGIPEAANTLLMLPCGMGWRQLKALGFNPGIKLVL